jgi:hypothetical protein
MKNLLIILIAFVQSQIFQIKFSFFYFNISRERKVINFEMRIAEGTPLEVINHGLKIWCIFSRLREIKDT